MENVNKQQYRANRLSSDSYLFSHKAEMFRALNRTQHVGINLYSRLVIAILLCSSKCLEVLEKSKGSAVVIARNSTVYETPMLGFKRVSNHSIIIYYCSNNL